VRTIAAQRRYVPFVPRRTGCSLMPGAPRPKATASRRRGLTAASSRVRHEPVMDEGARSAPPAGAAGRLPVARSRPARRA
jgi:hypothetical protein